VLAEFLAELSEELLQHSGAMLSDILALVRADKLAEVI
jgi:hypothetical protein